MQSKHASFLGPVQRTAQYLHCVLQEVYSVTILVASTQDQATHMLAVLLLTQLPRSQ